ncbi:MAG: DNA recombination protein RmuC [Bacteroidota bacterium]|nr:DNA recombination protein RmuC [Bacteroidota bacterium]
MRQAQQAMSDQSVQQLERINLQVEKSLSLMGESSRNDHQLMRATLDTFSRLQREKFEDLEKTQAALMESNEKKLEEMRVTVDEKLQKTLQERLGQSFEIVGQQLERVQKGLGEMQVLAQDVGGLKRVLANVKMRGGIGEVQLSMLLEQILAPEQYAANVKTKAGSSDHVEFAIKLPGREQAGDSVYLPVDAKFPAEVYQQLQDAFDSSDPALTEAATRNLEATVKKMAREISEKYLDPPNTTDFAIMFLPFEGIYAEIVRKASLLELLQREYKVIVTGPTTLAAILNSLQMGFRTLALQRRSSEVWQTLSVVKAEFGKFGGLLEKAQKNLQQASGQLDELMGKRTRAIQRSLREVESLPGNEEQELISGEGE